MPNMVSVIMREKISGTFVLKPQNKLIPKINLWSVGRSVKTIAAVSQKISGKENFMKCCVLLVYKLLQKIKEEKK